MLSRTASSRMMAQLVLEEGTRVTEEATLAVAGTPSPPRGRAILVGVPAHPTDRPRLRRARSPTRPAGSLVHRLRSELPGPPRLRLRRPQAPREIALSVPRRKPLPRHAGRWMTMPPRRGVGVGPLPLARRRRRHPQLETSNPRMESPVLWRACRETSFRPLKDSSGPHRLRYQSTVTGVDDRGPTLGGLP